MFAKTVVKLVMVAAPAAAHLSMWHPSMYGFDNDYSAYPMGYPSFVPFDQWWFHGNIDQPPADGQFFDLPAGGQAQAQVACNKGFTTYGGTDSPPENACPSDFGSLHEASADNTKGCSIAIAYKSDVRSVQPEDFVVISVNHACPWQRDVTFDIPAGLPACPEGGCHCMWGWVHGEDRGGDEMYMTGFKCKVSNPGNKQLSASKAPKRCSGGDCSGAKQPLYFSLVERANVNNDGGPPSYNDAFGWPNGAQNDIFTGATQPEVPNHESSSVAPTASHTSTHPQPTDGSDGDDTCDEDDEDCNDDGDDGDDEPTVSCSEDSQPTSTAPQPTTTSPAPSPTPTRGWTGGRHHRQGKNRWNQWNNDDNEDENDDDNDDDNDDNSWDDNNDDDNDDNKWWKWKRATFAREH